LICPSARVWEPYHKDGPGRPPRNPLGIFKALIVKRLWSSPKLREICDIEDYEKPYHPSQLCRFRKRIGPERLEGIMDSIVEKLREAGVIKGEVIACDAMFIKAYSKRDPHDDSRGYSDPEAGVGRAGKHMNLAIGFI